MDCVGVGFFSFIFVDLKLDFGFLRSFYNGVLKRYFWSRRLRVSVVGDGGSVDKIGLWF